MAHGVEESQWATHFFYFAVGRLNVEHRRQVAFLKARVSEEVTGLLVGWGGGGEEVIGSDGDVVTADSLVVFVIVVVFDRGSLGRFDVDKTDRIVDTVVEHSVVADASSQVTDAQAVPKNLIAMTPTLVLVARNVDAIDAVAVVAEMFAAELITKPCAHFQVARANTQSEAFPLVVLPVPLEISAVGSAINAMTAGLAA